MLLRLCFAAHCLEKGDHLTIRKFFFGYKRSFTQPIYLEASKHLPEGHMSY